jgi:hypothetical protein
VIELQKPELTILYSSLIRSQYTSITATETDMLNSSSIPRGFQLSLTGRNAIEQNIVNNWVVLYDNDCGIFPVVTEGMVAGWTVFVSEMSVSQLKAYLSHHQILTFVYWCVNDIVGPR